MNGNPCKWPIVDYHHPACPNAPRNTLKSAVAAVLAATTDGQPIPTELRERLRKALEEA